MTQERDEDETRGASSSGSRGVGSERALFDSILLGDELAAAEICGRLLPAIEVALYRVLGRGQSLGDLSTCCLEHVIRVITARSCPWVCSLDTWAKASSAQLGLQALRSRSRRRGTFDARAAQGGALTRASASGQRRNDRQSRIDLLRAHLVELPPRQANVVVLHELMGLTLTEVALTTGIPLEEVGSLLARGRAQLSARLTTPPAGGTWLATSPSATR
jgi:RNA polymerase sigma-70 factor (ECF subfamily)